MLLSLEKKDFQRELDRVVSVVERRHTVPILGYIHLDAGANALMLRGTDLDMEVAAPCGAEVKRQGVTCVNAHVLHGLVKKLPEGTISLTLDEAAARLKIRAGSSRIALPVLPPEDFPPTVSGDGGPEFIVDAGELRSMLEDCRFAICKDEVRYYLGGIYLHQDGEQLAAVATDGHRLSLRTMPLPAGADGMPAVILGAKLVGELLRTLPSEGEIALQVSEKSIAVTWSDVRIVSKLIDGTFPDYKRVIPANADGLIVVDRKALIEAAERVSVVLEAKGARAMAVSIEAAGLTLQARSPEFGVAQCELDAMVEGAHITLGINHRYLRDILSACDSDRIAIRYSGAPSEPMVIRPDGAEADAHLMVLMPMRVDEIEKIEAEKEAA